MPPIGRTAPLAAGLCVFLFHRKQQTALASVFPPALFLLKITGLFKVSDGSLHGAAGELQVLGNGTDGRITGSVLVCPVFQVSVDHYGTVRDIRSIKRGKIAQLTNTP